MAIKNKDYLTVQDLKGFVDAHNAFMDSLYSTHEPSPTTHLDSRQSFLATGLALICRLWRKYVRRN